MVQKNKSKKIIKTRHIITLVIIFILMAIIGLNFILPIGSGEHNQKQLDKVNSSPPSDQFSFAVMGDNKNSFRTFGEILKDVDSKDYIFSIDVGDLVFEGGKEYYRFFYNQIKDTKVPFLTAVGNHDIRDHGKENYTEIFGKFYYSFDYGNTLFIVLNDANKKRISPEQMIWLEKELQKDYQHKFVFLHVPPFDPRPDIDKGLEDKENAKEFMALMEKYNPDIVFASHMHAYFDETRNGVNYIITGGAGSELWGDASDHYFYHYIKVNIDGDKVDNEVVRFPPPYSNKSGQLRHNALLFINGFWAANKIEVVLTLLIIVLLIDLFIGWIKNYRKPLKTELK